MTKTTIFVIHSVEPYSCFIMTFFTPIDHPKSKFTISHQDRLLLLGSCFAENIGLRMAAHKFEVDINPFGILYNPASVGQAIHRLISTEPFTHDQLFEQEGLFHSFQHHSRFSAPDATECLLGMNERLQHASSAIRKTNFLIVTWGSAFVYRLKSSGEIVGNCHKLPERLFTRERLGPEEIVAQWQQTLEALWQINPTLKVLFTVSPIRHWKDGAHGNQLSKATLLLAIDELMLIYPEQTAYFPAYEILLDELRDYRFYADDMIHPSPLAIDYIWEKFATHWLSADTKQLLQAWAEIQKAMSHKPFQPQSEAYKKFVAQTLLKMEQFTQKFPFFDIQKETDEFNNRSNE